MSDYLFRWGGEEFALLVSRGGLESARRIAEKIRNALAAHDFGEVGSITVSAGVAERLVEESFEAWFERLDRALYGAKRSGRDCVVVDEAHEHGTNDLVLALGLRLQWEEAFECGEPTIGSSYIQFDLRFYVVALLFIIFDVEVAFFFPWALVFGGATQLADPRLALTHNLGGRPGSCVSFVSVVGGEPG